MSVAEDCEIDMSGSATKPAARVTFITGLSGAGKSTAIDTLEDIGYETIDNLPFRFLEHVALSDCEQQRGSADMRPLALGVDARTSGFDGESLSRIVARLQEQADTEVGVVFLDCDDDVIARRYTETRRRHPLATDRAVTDGIKAERHLLAHVRGLATTIIDTTQMTIHDLRRHMSDRHAPEQPGELVVTLTSFSFREGVPRQADLVFDVRFLSNPHYVPELRQQTGLDPKVAAHVAADPNFPPFYEQLTGLLSTTLPNYAHEGKTYLTIAVGCTGGQHRSVFVTERLSKWFEAQGIAAVVHHRELGISR